MFPPSKASTHETAVTAPPAILSEGKGANSLKELCCPLGSFKRRSRKLMRRPFVFQAIHCLWPQCTEYY